MLALGTELREAAWAPFTPRPWADWVIHAYTSESLSPCEQTPVRNRSGPPATAAVGRTDAGPSPWWLISQRLQIPSVSPGACTPPLSPRGSPRWSRSSSPASDLPPLRGKCQGPLPLFALPPSLPTPTVPSSLSSPSVVQGVCCDFGHCSAAPSSIPNAPTPAWKSAQGRWWGHRQRSWLS